MTCVCVATFVVRGEWLLLLKASNTNDWPFPGTAPSHFHTNAQSCSFWFSQGDAAHHMNHECTKRGVSRGGHLLNKGCTLFLPEPNETTFYWLTQLRGHESALIITAQHQPTGKSVTVASRLGVNVLCLLHTLSLHSVGKFAGWLLKTRVRAFNEFLRSFNMKDLKFGNLLQRIRLCS